MTAESNQNFEQMVTNLLITVTEIKGDIKLILHQQATSEQKWVEQKEFNEKINKRADTLEDQMTEAITAKKVMDKVYRSAIALLGAAVAMIGLYFQIH